MKSLRHGLIITVIAGLAACDNKPVANIKQHSPQGAPAVHNAKAFRTMTMTACECLDQSLWGQSMRDSYTYTVAGTVATGNGNMDIPANTSANSTYLYDISFDSAGNMFFIDYNNYKVKMVARNNGTLYGQTVTKGNVYTVVGTGNYNATASADGTDIANVNYYGGGGVAFDANDNMYLIDHNQVRVVPRQTSVTLFGVPMQKDKIYSIICNGAYGSPAADGTSALSSSSWGIDDIAIDSHGNVIISHYNDHVVQMVANSTNTFYGVSMAPNKVYRVAGNYYTGSSGDGGSSVSANLYHPAGLALDSNNNLFIADKYNNKVRTVARSTASYFGQSRTAGYIYTVAGNGTSGFAGDSGAASSAKLSAPTRVAIDDHDGLLIADTGNYRVRMVPSSTGQYYGQSMTQYNIYTAAGGGSGDVGSIATGTNFYQVFAVATDALGHMYLAQGNRVMTVPRCN